jgi:hypothetical protein
MRDRSGVGPGYSRNVTKRRVRWSISVDRYRLEFGQKRTFEHSATPLARHAIASQPLCLVHRAIGAREGLLYRLVGDALRYSDRYRQLTDRAGHWQFQRANPLT